MSRSSRFGPCSLKAGLDATIHPQTMSGRFHLDTEYLQLLLQMHLADLLGRTAVRKHNAVLDEGTVLHASGGASKMSEFAGTE